MLYANSMDNQKILATPETEATCPYCNSLVVPKCGSINTHHWSHKSLVNCDPWYKSETEWHLEWKRNFPKESTEVLLTLLGERHIADYFNKLSRTTIEFQNSNISIEERLRREAFYPNLIWVYNVNTQNIISTDTWGLYQWKYPKKSLIYGMNKNCRYIIDGFPDEESLFEILKVDVDYSIKSNDFGSKWSKETFIDGVDWEKSYFITRNNENRGWF
jgi:hypothetical protein